MVRFTPVFKAFYETRKILLSPGASRELMQDISVIRNFIKAIGKPYLITFCLYMTDNDLNSGLKLYHGTTNHSGADVTYFNMSTFVISKAIIFISELKWQGNHHVQSFSEIVKSRIEAFGRLITAKGHNTVTNIMPFVCSSVIPQPRLMGLGIQTRNTTKNTIK